MKELSYYINDVRLATDNLDVNGVKNREIIRYFNDGIKSIQAIIFKNNPLCSYFQRSVDFTPVSGSREYDLPSDCYALNAVSRVEVQSENGLWYPLERAWPEDNFHGWYTANGKLILTGDETREYPETIRAWYFYRLPYFNTRIDYISTVAAGLIQLSNDKETICTELLNTDNRVSIVSQTGEILNDDARVESVATFNLNLHPYFGISAADVITLTAEARKSLVWGKNASFILDLPDEVEPYLLDYVSKRIFGRNNYGAEASKIEMFSQEAKGDLVAIFADAGQSIARAPITDTSFLRI